jgi:hypothetical protein
MQNVKDQYKNIEYYHLELGLCMLDFVFRCTLFSLCNICYPDYSLLGGQGKGKISVERFAGNTSY